MSGLSLIPYLEPRDGKFHLAIASCPSTDDRIESARHPFRILNDHDPFWRLFKAEIVSEPGRNGLPLFLLVQRNRYRYTPDQLRPLNNLDLERFWQQTHTFLSTERNTGNIFFPLKDDIGSNGLPAVFRPVFFCSRRHRFFHPPCPSCGNFLELCKNDEILTSKGLSAYSTSLERYLYCPACNDRGGEVYAYAREETEPQIVRNSGELIRSWRHIVTERVEVDGFPCTGCPEHTACYGESALSDIRITPFLFYPSPILSFEAASLSAADFLSMVSGASVEDIVSGRHENIPSGRKDRLMKWRRSQADAARYLFNGRTELFLEILYLKLAFLSEVAGILLFSTGAPVPIDIFSSFDSLWVMLPKQNGLLPSFWNFKTCLFTVGPCKRESWHHPESHPSRAHCCLGIIWLITLLRNKYQTVRDIEKALAPGLNNGTGFSNMNRSPITAPNNNFWNPDSMQREEIPEPFEKLWRRSLSLGQRLLLDVFPEDPSVFAETFMKDLEGIQREIKYELLFEKNMPETARPAKTPDREIHRILSGISEKWRTNPKSPPAIQPQEEETLTRTIIISKNNAHPLPEFPKAVVNEETRETVILKKNTLTGKPSSALPAHSRPDDFDMGNDEDDLAETVIIRPSGKKEPK